MATARFTKLSLLLVVALISSFLVRPPLPAAAQSDDPDGVTLLDPEHLAPPPLPDNRVGPFSDTPESPDTPSQPAESPPQEEATQEAPPEEAPPQEEPPPTDRTESNAPACNGLTDDRPFLDRPDHSLGASGPEHLAAISFQGPDPANLQVDSASSSPSTAALLTSRSRVFFTDENALCHGTYGRWYDFNSASVRCTGTLIDPEWVLTAAHCVSNYKPGGVSGIVGIVEHDVQIRLGSAQWNSGGQLYDVVETHIHPEWSRQVFEDGTWRNNPDTWTGDLALLRIASPASQEPAGVHAVSGRELPVEQVTRGWGINEQGNAPTTRLWWTNDLVGDDECASNDPTATFEAEESLCVDVLDGFGACFGDSGSSIGTTNPATNSFEVTGVASYIILTGSEGPHLTHCDDPRYVAYTHIDGPRLEWVLETIG